MTQPKGGWPCYKSAVTESGKSTSLRWLDRPVFVRVDAGATGWTMQPDTLTALLGLSWGSLALDRAGLTALKAEGDADAISTKLGPFVRRLSELDTVEVRSDVVALVVEGSVTDPGSVAVANASRSSEAEPVAVLTDAAGTTWVFDAWRKADLETALTP